MEKIALDTSACIAMLKDYAFAQKLTLPFINQKPFLPTVAAFELLMRAHSVDKIETFMAQTELLYFDKNSAKKAAEIAKELRSKGTPIGTNDVLIAATAIVNDCSLATLDTKDFSKIKGLKLVKIN